MEKLSQFAVSDYLKTEADFQAALKAAYEDDPGDGSLIAATLGNMAKVKGMTQLAKDTGLSREGLCRALSGKGHPAFATILKVSRALGFALTPTAINRAP